MVDGSISLSSRRRTVNGEPIGRDELLGYVVELLEPPTTKPTPTPAPALETSDA
jgi:hypothetical protein